MTSTPEVAVEVLGVDHARAVDRSALAGPSAGGPAGAGWVAGPAGLWRTSPVPGQVYVLPHEYRLAFDRESGLPAMTVLLVNPPADQPADAYRVRVRFELVAWFDPVRTAQLREDMAEGTVSDIPGIADFPDLVVGGYDTAEFAASSLLADLGGTVLGDGVSSTVVDGRGFELVLDCNRPYHTMLTRLLAPPTGPPTGLEGRVRFTLRGPDGVPTVRDVPVRIRLDVPADDFLAVDLLPPPAGMSPARPPRYVRVRNLARGDADVAGLRPVMLLGDGPPWRAVAARVEPGSFRVGAVGSEPPPPPSAGPPPPPAFPGQGTFTLDSTDPAVRTYQLRLVELGFMEAFKVNGRFAEYTRAMTERLQREYGLPTTGEVDEETWKVAFPPPPPPPPLPGAGEVVLAVRPVRAVDLRTVGAVALHPTGVVLHVAAPTVLRWIHEVAAGTPADTSVRVFSYQLAHPEHLPPALADVYGLEVQIHLAGRPEVTAYLSRDEPEKTVALNLLVGDLIDGVDPRQPTFEWRRRNLTFGGPGAFSAWETVSSRELFAVPVLPPEA